jgi:hypothetical protein
MPSPSRVVSSARQPIYSRGGLLMSLRPRIALIALFTATLAFCAAGALGAETIMIAVQESVDGAPSQPPLPTLEGVSGALFDAGHIVFDAGKLAPSVKTAELARIARDANAGWLLRVNVVYTQTKVDKDSVRVACSATFSLVNAENGTTSLSDKVSATNAGRERNMDRAALGMELGKLISQKVVRALPSPSL